MTEAQWLDGADVIAMVAFLTRRLNGRKLRLFVCACCRSLWEWMDDPRSRRAVEAGEKYADGLLDDAALEGARREAWEVHHRAWADVAAAMRPGEPGGERERNERSFRSTVTRLAVCAANRPLVRRQANAIAGWALSAHGYLAAPGKTPSGKRWEAAWRRHEHWQADCLRCLFGNPYRPVLPRGGRRAWKELRRWLAWNDGIVPRLAGEIYVERAFERLPILADALEEAGCDNGDILNHSRGAGVHARGCWVVDLILGKG